MTDDNHTTSFQVRATDPASNKEATCECIGFARACAKAAQLRLAGFKDVVVKPAATAPGSPHPWSDDAYSLLGLKTEPPGV